jgi:hypothetical protein
MNAADPIYHANGTYRHLWAAVIQQALDDLSQCHHASLEFADAKNFLVGYGQWAESRQHVCDLLGHDPDTLVSRGLEILSNRPECREDLAAARRAWDNRTVKLLRGTELKQHQPRCSTRNEFHPSQLDAVSPHSEPKHPQLSSSNTQPTTLLAPVVTSTKRAETFVDVGGKKRKYTKRTPVRRFFLVQEKWFRAA